MVNDMRKLIDRVRNFGKLLNEEKKYKHKETEFQKTFPYDGEAIINIIEILYPDLNINWNNERGNLIVMPHPYYTWVEVKYKDGNCISFGINNHYAEYNGEYIYGELSPEIYKKLNFKFEVIPFNTKCNENISEKRKERVHKLLKSLGYKKPSFQEWWNEYHTD